jgi:hypothetical protein
VLKRLLIAGILVCIVIAAIVIGFYEHQHSNSLLLSQYLAQLRAQGEKLTFVELAASPSTNEDEIESRNIFASNRFPEVKYDPVLMQFVAPGKATVAWRGEIYMLSNNEDGSVLRTTIDWKDLERENRALSTQLQVFRGALKHPAPDNGWVYDDTFSNVMAYKTANLRMVHHVGQGLANAVLEDMRETNIDSAVAGISDIAALAKLYRNDLEYVNVAARAGRAKEGLDLTWELLQNSVLDDQQLAQLESRWNSLDLLSGLELALLSERYMHIVVMEEIRRTRIDKMHDWVSTDAPGPGFAEQWLINLQSEAYKFNGLDEDELMQLRFAAAFIDAARSLRTGTGLSEAIRPIGEAVTNDRKLMEKMKGLRREANGAALLDLRKSFTRIAQVETQRRMTLVAIAIRRYQLRHGAAPSNLTALVPDYLAVVPMDVMSRKPLCYRLNPDGSFVLYSTGEDGIDDGGDSTPKDGGTNYGLWEGRDAVWPTVASPEEEAAWGQSLAKTNALH